MEGKEIKSTSAGLFTGILGASASGGSALCAGACGAVCGTSTLSVFGVSTGTLGAVLDEWQTAWIGISLLTFAYSFYSLYFKKAKAACATGTECGCAPTKVKSQTRQKAFLWLALAFSIGFYAYPSFTAASQTAETGTSSNCSVEFLEAGGKSCSSVNGSTTKADCTSVGNGKTDCSTSKKACSGGK